MQWPHFDEYIHSITQKHKLNQSLKPWFTTQDNYNPTKKVIVIGGGISGAATAYSLAQRGYSVTLYEKNPELAMEASGNYQGMLYGSFSGNHTPILELSLAGFRYSHNLIRKLLTLNQDYLACGLIQLATNVKQLKSQQQILSEIFAQDFCHPLNHAQIEKQAGIPVNCQNALYFPHALCLNPPSFVKELCKHPNIKVICDTYIDEIIQKHDESWSIFRAEQEIDNAPNLVICNAHAIDQFTQTKELHIRKIRGQISIIKTNLYLKTVIAANGYITPNRGDYFTVGATFKFNSQDTDIRHEEHQENITNIASSLPTFVQNITGKEIIGQASVRASTMDYLPMVGPIADYALFNQTYALLAKDSNYRIKTPCPYLKGLYINIAHGAKGFLTAPLCGELIASYISNTKPDISDNLQVALHPNRFWLKNIIKHSPRKFT